VLDIKNNEECTYKLVSPDEADFELDKISIVSPLGNAILGKKVGEIAEFVVPAGTIKYKILQIKK
jgi:transcription elongation factor GreA